MRVELDKALCQRYPALFAERSLPAEESGMGRGFECGDGWFGLIESLCAVIDMAVRQGDMPAVRVAQVKEKYGSLCFRYRGGNAITYGMVRLAEHRSEHIDEATGIWRTMTLTEGGGNDERPN